MIPYKRIYVDIDAELAAASKAAAKDAGLSRKAWLEHVIESAIQDAAKARAKKAKTRSRKSAKTKEVNNNA